MIGNLCVKLAGREGKKYCIIVDKIDSTHVLIDGNVKRRKCNISHLEITPTKLDIKKGASSLEVKKAMEKAGIKITEPKGKKSAQKPIRKTKKTAKDDKS